VLDHDPLARAELADLLERRHRIRDVAEREVRRDRLGVELRVHEAARQHALQLRAEDDHVVRERVVERLDAQPVAHEHTAAALAVPDREREHAAQAVRQRRAVLLVEVREDLGVAAAAEHVAAIPQPLAQRGVVVDLTVLRRPDATALVRERLVAALDVDDREAPGAERAAVGRDEARVVGPAVLHDVGHRPQDVLGQGGCCASVQAEGAGDSTHGTNGRRSPAREPYPSVQ
jgi:hypothetical protein